MTIESIKDQLPQQGGTYTLTDGQLTPAGQDPAPETTAGDTQEVTDNGE